MDNNVRVFDEDYNERDGEVIEVNGNLALIEDTETGEQDWYCPHEYDDY